MGFSFKEWYEKHGDELNSTRKQRYAQDPEYRSVVLAQNAEVRAKRRKQKQLVKAEENDAKRTSVKDEWVELEGADGATYLPMRVLAKALGRSVRTLRVWEAKGLLPPTPHRSFNGERLYTPKQILELREHFQKLGKATDSPRSRRIGVTRRVRMPDGTESAMHLLRIGDIAPVVGRSVSVLLTQEKQGRLPMTPLITKGKHRVYTVEQVDSLRLAYAYLDHKGGFPVWEEFHALIVEQWTDLGLYNMQVLD